MRQTANMTLYKIIIIPLKYALLFNCTTLHGATPSKNFQGEILSIYRSITANKPRPWPVVLLL